MAVARPRRQPKSLVEALREQAGGEIPFDRELLDLSDDGLEVLAKETEASLDVLSEEDVQTSAKLTQKLIDVRTVEMNRLRAVTKADKEIFPKLLDAAKESLGHVIRAEEATQRAKALEADRAALEDERREALAAVTSTLTKLKPDLNPAGLREAIEALTATYEREAAATRSEHGERIRAKDEEIAGLRIDVKRLEAERLVAEKEARLAEKASQHAESRADKLQKEVEALRGESNQNKRSFGGAVVTIIAAVIAALAVWVAARYKAK